MNIMMKETLESSRKTYADQAFFTGLRCWLVTLKIEIKMATTTLARWMWSAVIVVESGHRPRWQKAASLQKPLLLPGKCHKSVKNYSLPA